MKKISLFLICIMLFVSGIWAQIAGKEHDYDLSKDKVLYTIGYSHLDSEWNWDYVHTIDLCIKNVMEENFHLMEKYPDYVFNFTGSRRYAMMKEYYPLMYEQVKQYVNEGRWHVSGSSVDEGEVNVSSSESLIRQVLYGNQYFQREFDVESVDYMLPDCFGFLANLPTIWNHCGLLGFSTQKLTWHSANGIPFNVGVWNGPDGKGIIAALNATSYTSPVDPRLDLSEYWDNRIRKNTEDYGISFDYKYYGVGDEGGAPRECDVKNAVGSLNNSDSKFKVELTSSDQMYKDITPEIREKLPTYAGDLLLIEHSAGSLTSQAFMKRMNRKNELLAKAAEPMAAISDWMGLIDYPTTKLYKSWDLVLGSQFHDILPGTSIPKAYEYAWNDELVAQNGFENVLKSSVSSIAGQMDTKTSGRAIVVYNPVAKERDDIVSFELEYSKMPENIQVYDANGEPVLTQITELNGSRLKGIFQAKVPSMGLAVFDVRTVSKPATTASTLKVDKNLIENDYYRVEIDENGDFASIWDKKAGKELLEKPARLEFQAESPKEWPAWNMDWEDRKEPPVGFMNESASIKVIEQGSVRCALEITRRGRNSSIKQIVSLSAGNAGRRVEVSNLVDWQSKGVSLKAAFPLTVNNKVATYNLGVGTIQRENNNAVKFEVPAKEWFDLTDEDGNYGVTVLEDCKYGSDKPADNELRLTLLYTPEAHSWYPVQTSQDWGMHEFRYGIYGHSGSWQTANSDWQGQFFNQPLMAFESEHHSGKLGTAISLLKVNRDEVGLMAYKKMEDNDYLLVRVNELCGKDLEAGAIDFPVEIEDAYEVNGQENRIGDAGFKGNKLSFDLSHYSIKSFAVKLKSSSVKAEEINQQQLALPYNQDVFSFDDNRNDGNFNGARHNIPAELVPDEIVSEGIRFKVGSREDEQLNAVKCTGQQIEIPKGTKTLYFLAAADEDTSGDFKLGDQVLTMGIQKWTNYIGQYYNRKFALDGVTVIDIDKPFLKDDNIAWYASHRHQAYPTKNETYQYTYIFKYGIEVPDGATSIQLPENKQIKIVAMTALKDADPKVKPVTLLIDDLNSFESVSVRGKRDKGF